MPETQPIDFAKTNEILSAIRQELEAEEADDGAGEGDAEPTADGS